MPLATYRKVLEQMWTAKLLAGEHLASLVQLQGQLGITAEDAGAIEQEVMGMTKAEAMVMGIAKSTPPTSVPPVPAIDPGESPEQPEPRDDDFSGATQVPNGRGATSLPAADEGDLDLEGGTYAPAPPAVHGDRNDLASGMHLGLGNRYELLDKIGEGGMGTVWRAKDLTLDGRIVAMKRIRLFDEADRQMVARFAQERQTIAGLNHSNVVTVYDAGDDQYGPYLVMELVEGEPLDQLIKHGALPEPRAAEIIEGLCRGVAHAHKKGVIHRDIKPANVIVNSDGIPKLLDFGLARGNSGLELSMSSYGMGTLDYAAPEQKRDAKSVDHRADIYSLGLTFYELLTGLNPVPLALRKVPEDWQDLIACACEPDPSDRYQTVDAMLGALENREGVRLGNDSTKKAPMNAPVTKAKSAGHVSAQAHPILDQARAGILNPFDWEVLDATKGANGLARRVHDPATDVTFVLIDPGDFVMGSPEDAEARYENEVEHRVTLTRPYYLGETPITQEQWARCFEESEQNGGGLFGLRRGRDWAPPSHFEGVNHPVESVNWEDVQKYCVRWTQRSNGVTYRLPTEAEWEYACRAGSTTRFSSGDLESGLHDTAWYRKNSNDKIHPVKSKKPNAWGLHDMHGNVWEWCSDWYSRHSEATSVNPTGPSFGSHRVVRGGSWNSTTSGLRSAQRSSHTPSLRHSNVGFRVLAVPPSSPSAKAGKGG